MKAVSPAKEMKIKAREQKELARLNKRKTKPRYAGYFGVILFIILFVNVIDEITSSLPTYMQSSYVMEFFVHNQFGGKVRTFEEGLAVHTLVSAVSYAFGLFTPFYKALADKFGRKPLFFTSTLGMSVGMLIVFYSTNYYIFLVGCAVMSFFISHDIQIIYILEEAPSKHRARIYSVLKGLGILGGVAIPTLRTFAMGNDPTKWRTVFLYPAIAGGVACLAVLLFAKETKIFLEERSEYLSIPYEERQAEKLRKKQEKESDTTNTGVINGIKHIFSKKDTKRLIIAHIVFDIAIAAIGLYHESMMKTAGIETAEITKALYVIPFVYAGCVILSGFTADVFGRKKTVLGGSVCNLLFLVAFIVGLKLGLNSYLVGFFAGVYQAGYWIGRDYMDIMLTEKVPTEIRASVIGAEGLLVTAGMAVGYVLMIIGLPTIGVFASVLTVTIPAVGASIFFMGKVKETKGTDMSSIETE